MNKKGNARCAGIRKDSEQNKYISFPIRNGIEQFKEKGPVLPTKNGPVQYVLRKPEGGK